LFSTFVHEKFLDIPLLPDNKYGTDGLFYNLPFLHDGVLDQNRHSQDLIVVYRIQDGISECPLRIEFELKDDVKKSSPFISSTRGISAWSNTYSSSTLTTRIAPTTKPYSA